jgi:hypothetical protein
VTDIIASKRRRRKREVRPELDRRSAAPFNAETAERAVPDPYSTTGGKIVVTASLRDDPLGQFYARRHIDEAQYRAGLKLLEWFDLAEIGSVQAIDPSKEPVDGRGAFVEPITDRQLDASRKLAHVHSVLGKVGYDLCRSVIAGGLIMEQVAAAAGNSSQRSIDFWARRFRECLQTLAVAFGATGKRGRAPSDKYTELAIKHEESENVRQS